jgi:DNA-binding helix-hairpin-helix protein with protein kinase domain
LEQKGVSYFIDLGTTYKATSTGFVLAQAWAMIEAVPAPPPVAVPGISGISVAPTPLPPTIPGNGKITAYRFIVAFFAIAAFAVVPKAWFIVALATWVGWAAVSAAGGAKRQAERTKRKTAQDLARNELDALIERAKKEAGPEGFHVLKEALKKLRDEFQALPAEEIRELDNLHATAQARQKQKFLERFFLDSADIPGVGPTRKATLRSFGIETAADVSRNRVLQVKGFGDSLTRAVTDWRASCERKFVFNPAATVSDSDRNAVRAKFGNRRSALASSIGAGAAELHRFRQAAVTRAASLRPQLEQSARKFAQAQCDLSLL